MADLEFTFSFDGLRAEEHVIEMYDVAKAMSGFQRSLALTTHLIVNNEIITQAPSLKNAAILTRPIEEGSWKVTAIVTAGVFATLTAAPDTPPGHLIHSAYSYVIQETLGFEVDYEKTLQKQIHEHNEKNKTNLDQSRLDSVVEKCENSIIDMHRPIVKSKTASFAEVSCKFRGKKMPKLPILDIGTYEYVSETTESQFRSKLERSAYR